MTFRLETFPAGDGDCMLLTWGDDGDLRHMVVDGGRAAAYPHLRKRLEAIGKAGGTLELLVLTHIDADHIEGVLAMAKDEELPLAPKRVWYNGYDQMARVQPFSVAQGDEWPALLAEREWPLNPDFPDGTVTVEARPDPFDLAGLRITLLSPDAAKLSGMRHAWAAWRTAQAARKSASTSAPGGVQAMGREPMPVTLDVNALAAPTAIDSEPPNGSSIAFIAEWQGSRVLLAGDAHPDLLAASLAPLAAAAGGRLAIRLLKVPHHGSRGNVTRELIELLDCDDYLISTDGKRHGHPDPQAIARILKFAPERAKTLRFTHSTGRTEPWDDAGLKAKHGYDTVFADPPGFLTVDL